MWFKMREVGIATSKSEEYTKEAFYSQLLEDELPRLAHSRTLSTGYGAQSHYSSGQVYS
jgi:hypothetical protein